jgi:putative phosphoesterase
MQTIGVLADTHVPDRATSLNPRVLSIFRESHVAAVIYAGDVCLPAVLAQLRSVAPVYAVQGNRDIWWLSDLPQKISLDFRGVSIGITHGHGGFWSYFSQKLSYFVKGYQFHYYKNRLRVEFPSAQVIVFGHTHRSENTWSDGVLIFNPGPASQINWGIIQPSVGLLHIRGDGGITGEIIPLDAV